MQDIFFVLGGFLFASAVIKGKDGSPSAWYAVGAWACGSVWMLSSGKPLDSIFLLSSAAQAGLAFFGWKFGKWLGVKGQS
jgi:hypothetical protein